MTNVLIKGMYSFRPSGMGSIGFTVANHRASFLSRASDGDLVVLYAANKGVVEPSRRGRAFAIVQIEAREISTADRMSAEEIQLLANAPYAGRWGLGVPVKRAWNIILPPEIRMLAPTTYLPHSGMKIATQGAILTEYEKKSVLDLQVQEQSVFGEAPIEVRSPELLGESLSRQ